ncbi:hypothetical protein B0A52_02590 [Exophiala mesophila]|uniref:DUF3669 domain-containing protein n=1 Tax=Exophiala mesophila TaxID=212818 RepID=A0A438NDA1_EXOME|nr:hypothetical protein B0A52_02590 [Exophiala mesophila]
MTSSSSAAPLEESKSLPKASNRRQQVSSYSVHTPSLENLAIQNLRLEDQLLQQAANETNEQTLKRLLSTKSAISTTSSFAERQQASYLQGSGFREIGTGSIGTVLEHPGTIWAYKFALLDQSDKLWNNYLMGLQVQQSFALRAKMSADVAIPQCMWFATAYSQFWTTYKSQIPDSRRPGDVLCMERIFPLPEVIRNKLIDVFCQLDPASREQAKKIASNKNCLIRPYLGRARITSGQSRLRAFSLRNYKLHLDQIQYIGLDVEELASSMAKAMAIMHWDIGIDAADAEFVLGSSPTVEGTVPPAANDITSLLRTAEKVDTFREVTISNPNFKQRLVTLWLLDFDACGKINTNAAGVQRAVKAFLENEPYCPRPNGGSNYCDHLWSVFGNQYLETSRSILVGVDGNVASLPVSFLTGVVKALAGSGSSQPQARRGDRQSQETLPPIREGSQYLSGQRSGRGHFRERADIGSGQPYSKLPSFQPPPGSWRR